MTDDGNEHQVRIARINAWQAILVAVVSAAGAVITTIAIRDRISDSKLGAHQSEVAAVTDTRPFPKPQAVDSNFNALQAERDALMEKLKKSEIQVSKLSQELSQRPKTPISGSAPVPAFYYTWFGPDLPTPMGTIRCKELALKVLSTFEAKNIGAASITVFGSRGEYAVFIGCIADAKIVLLAAVGPNAVVAEQLSTKMLTEFKQQR